MGIFGSNLKIQSELSLEKISGTGITVDVGHAIISEIGYTGSDVSDNLEQVSDITNPSGWQNLVNISGSKMLISVLKHSTGSGIIQLEIDDLEDAGEDIRAQILVDGTVVADFTVTRDTNSPPASAIGNYASGPIVGSATSTYVWQFECNSSFTIRACYESANSPGAFGNAGTFIKHGAVHWSKLA